MEIEGRVYDSRVVASRSDKGWSSLPGFEEIDATSGAEATDAAMTVPAFEFDYDDATDDPESGARTVRPGARGFDDSGAPTLDPDDSGAPTVRPGDADDTAERAPPRKLTLPPPGAADTLDPSSGGPAQSPVLSDAIVGALDAPARPAPPPSIAAKAAYRNVVIATIVGSALLGLAIAYSTTRAPIRVRPNPPVPTGPANPTQAALPKTEVAPPAKAPVAPATRMVTVVSTPPGAVVEVNGVPFGKTTLVKPAPEGVEELEVVVKLFGYETWRDQVRPNGLGHYSVNVRLRPKR